MAKKDKLKISELVPDSKNFNRGTAYGNSLIEKSLRKFGAGRSIVIDKNNKIIAGNKTIENAGAIGLENVTVIETDGNEIVAVKRMDIDIDTKRGREMALADNATSKASVNFDSKKIYQEFEEEEFEEWGISKSKVKGAFDKNKSENFDPLVLSYPITIIFKESEYEQWLKLREKIKGKTDNDVIMKIIQKELK